MRTREHGSMSTPISLAGLAEGHVARDLAQALRDAKDGRASEQYRMRHFAAVGVKGKPAPPRPSR